MQAGVRQHSSPALRAEHQQDLLLVINHWCQGEQRGAVSSGKAIPQLGEHQDVVPSQRCGCVGQGERGVIKRENNAKIAMQINRYE